MGTSSNRGLGALMPVRDRWSPRCFWTAAPAFARTTGDEATQVIATTEPDPDGEGWIEVSRHLDPIDEFTSDRQPATTAVAGSGSAGGAAQARSLAEGCAAVNRTTDDATNNYQPASSPGAEGDLRLSDRRRQPHLDRTPRSSRRAFAG